MWLQDETSNPLSWAIDPLFWTQENDGLMGWVPYPRTSCVMPQPWEMASPSCYQVIPVCFWEDDQAWEMLALAVPTSGVWADYVSTTNFLFRTSFDGNISFLGKILMAIFPFWERFWWLKILKISFLGNILLTKNVKEFPFWEKFDG